MLNTKMHIVQKIMAAAFLFFVAAWSWTFASHTTDNQKTVIVMDSGKRKAVQTDTHDAKTILRKAQVSLKKYDAYWMSEDKASGSLLLVVERAVPVTITYEGKSRQIYTVQQTVQGVLHDAGYDWKKVMALEDGMKQVSPGMTIHAVPYTVRRVMRTEALPPAMAMWYDNSLPSGAQEIIDPGQPGQRVVLVEEYMVQGKVLRSAVIQAEVIDQGVAGSARIGLQDNTVGQIFHMEATAYHPSDGGGHGITASGMKAGRGKIAVDPGVIPLGTKVYIPSYGEAIAADTGGAIIGNRVDLCMETFEECYNFGRRPVDVYVPNQI